jgi:hypothetical protein
VIGGDEDARVCGEVHGKAAHPFDLRVSESRIILASTTVPYCAKKCERSASVACHDTPPTNTFSAVPPPPPPLLLPPSPSRASTSAPATAHAAACVRELREARNALLQPAG